MTIYVNGERKTLPDVMSIQKLLESFNLHTTRVAIELNRQIIPQSHFQTTTLKNGDCIEIVEFVGGG